MKLTDSEYYCARFYQREAADKARMAMKASSPPFKKALQLSAENQSRMARLKMGLEY